MSLVPYITYDLQASQDVCVRHLGKAHNGAARLDGLYHLQGAETNRVNG
jgi:hypothetical protein